MGVSHAAIPEGDGDSWKKEAIFDIRLRKPLNHSG
jgi:hypothetical protein